MLMGPGKQQKNVGFDRSRAGRFALFEFGASGQ